MKFETEGIVLKQIKTVGGRRMIVLLSARYGKISAGSRINEGGRNKSALAMRPFTYGRYQIFKSRDIYNIDSAETISDRPSRMVSVAPLIFAVPSSAAF